jgi:predicted transcriptional regulator of viral defense system
MKLHYSSPAGQFVEELLGQGRYSFTKEEFSRQAKRSPGAVNMALYRLVKAKRLVAPCSGFYVIVDAQHRKAGTLPPEWFINELMKSKKRPYYVGLLSAAQVHGAAHHRPQKFQVVISGSARRPMNVGNVQIRFFQKGPFDVSQAEAIKTPTGFMRVSTPENTAWDLVRYFKASGGWDNVMTVLSELAEKLDTKNLKKVCARQGETIVTQRLGYLLEHAGHKALAAELAGLVRHAPLRPLDPSERSAGSPANRKWHLKINASPVSEA